MDCPFKFQAQPGSGFLQSLASPDPIWHTWPVTAACFLARHPATWQQAISHRFLDGVRSGALPSGAFEAWLVQDYLFVTDLLVFQARLLASAPLSAQAVLSGGVMALESELSWFEEQAARRGLELAADRLPATRAYAAELERLAAAPFPVAMTALWAMERAYLDAWQSAVPGTEPYREFVQHWTQPDFRAYVSDLEKHTVDSAQAEAIWFRIVGLERDFWSMAV